ncbi:MAG: hypothetical protein PHT12_05600 [Patescibacteria group bacterium]|nr:hypothetical protein [Patescibacteria group bacterium]
MKSWLADVSVTVFYSVAAVCAILCGASLGGIQMEAAVPAWASQDQYLAGAAIGFGLGQAVTTVLGAIARWVLSNPKSRRERERTKSAILSFVLAVFGLNAFGFGTTQLTRGLGEALPAFMVAALMLGLALSLQWVERVLDRHAKEDAASGRNRLDY